MSGESTGLPRLSPRVVPIPFPPISAVRRRLAERPDDGRPLVDLCQAVPDYAPEMSLRDFMSRAVLEEATARYTPDEGLPGVRESLSRWYAERYGAAPQADRICLTIGASQAFWLAMSVLCAEGDEVIVPLPAYFDHPMGLAALGITPRYIPFDEQDGGVPHPESIVARITPRTRALLLVTPSNPSGAVIPPPVLEACFELARRHGIMLVVDETYNAFLPGDAVPHRLFSRPDWDTGLIHLASFGKTFALTGYRAGALIASSQLVDQALKVQDSMVVCQPHLTQLALRYACTHLDAWVRERNADMQRRQAQFSRAFCTPGNPFELVAAGGFFAWVRHPCRGVSSVEVVTRLVDEAHLACLPGAAFGPGLEDYLRLAIGNLGEHAIPSAVARLMEWAP